MKKFIILFLICVVNICVYASRDVVPSDSVLADYYTHGNVCVCIYVPTDMACNDIVLTGSFNNWSTTIANCAMFEAIAGYEGWFVTSFEPEDEPDAEMGIQARPVMLDAYGNFDWSHQAVAATIVRGEVQVVQRDYIGEIDLIHYGVTAPNIYIVDAWKQNPCPEWENLTWNLTNGVLTISGNGYMPQYSGMLSPWFYFRDSINSIVINEGVKSIGSNIFYNCVNLTSIIIPNSVTSIGEYAFRECINLTSVTIPNSVTYIGTGAFSGCTGLISPVYNSYIFAYMPTSYSGTYAIHSGLESIANGAFSGCSNLTSVTIPNSITSIGYSAFEGCTSLTYVTIPNSVTKIGSNAFSGCTYLTDIYATCGDLDRVNQLLNNDSRVKYIPLPFSLTIHAVNGKVNAPQYACDSLELFATPNYGYHFDHWSDGNADNPRAIELTQDTTFEAIFEPNKYSIIVFCDSTRGTIEGSSGDFDYLTKLTYNAVANYGYHFDHWSDGSTENPRIVSITRNISLEAFFVPNSYTIYIVCNPSQGTISGAGTYEYLESCIVQAYPNRGFSFLRWDDGNTENPRIVELTQDTTLGAIFNYIINSKCGKDSVLTWSLDTANMELNITGQGALSENYTYGTFIESLIIGNEVTIIGQAAFSNFEHLKTICLGSSVKVLESRAFSNCTAISTIICYSQRPPTVNNNALYGLDYSTMVYVPADYLENYKMHDAWGLYDVRPLSAKSTETTEVAVTPSDNTATIVWPAVTGAATYELVIKDKDGNIICTLIFNENGQLTSIAFNAPGRNAPQQTQSAGFLFTVTGLDSGTGYVMTMTSKDNNGAILQTETISFVTNSPQAIDPVTGNPSSVTRKVIKDGQVLILKNGKTYNALGAEMK